MTQITQQQILDAFKFRAATRAYDPNKKVSREQMAFLLELARLSPSSVGTEPWQFLVVESAEIRAKLKPFCWGMAGGIDDASYIVFILAKKNVRYDSPDLVDSLKARNLSEQELQATIDVYRTFQRDHIKVLENERTLFDWAGKQTYIALANMMTGAAMLGIDSCPYEGFNYAEVNRILSEAGLMDSEQFGVSVAVSFGYRAKTISQKSRKPAAQVVRWEK
ncbi:NAD(P)H-dependent oxidoreductase [Actinobacillus porcinus]|uniref:NAD(P)H-dependent oxidoreductase n=1 Tax=Actinobacillus porcinus TaxID=51048 RepID=UPI002352BB1D|nr:NAD(P)H-dependent oxidoreductase [Actinobacillus porcinus]MCI5764914.1 NAD(P)H-dependent oxidoreductase [Actinobacillus porcinus]MDY5421906.1 NAD(P)H-dependent oxidoreductase [Actinobacillus porcinus]